MALELDAEFFSSLRIWVERLSETRFAVDDGWKLRLIASLIIKLIVTQILSDLGVVEPGWLRRRWEECVDTIPSGGKLAMLERFLGEIDGLLSKHIGTDLLNGEVLRYIDKSGDNVTKFYEALQLVLGLAPGQGDLGVKGVTHYSFGYVDEDILGRVYEALLMDARREKGVYYTPEHVAQYMVENTVGKIFDMYLAEIEGRMRNGDLDGAEELLLRLISIRVLDPACGSGSFLVRALRSIAKRYRRLREMIEENMTRRQDMLRHQTPRDDGERLGRLSGMMERIGRSEWEMILKIIARHIYGVDIDGEALKLARINIWIEALKQASRGSGDAASIQNMDHVPPILRINLRNGDSLVGLPEELTISSIWGRHQSDLRELSRLRQEYLRDPARSELLDKIEGIMSRIRIELDEELKRYIEGRGISAQIASKTKPLHWALEYWFAFFNEHGEPLGIWERGFDIVIGNPPYIDHRAIVRIYGGEYAEFLRREYRFARGHFDITVPFTEKALRLLKRGGLLSYIVSNKFMVAEYGYELRKHLLTRQMLIEVIDVSRIRVFRDASIYPAIFAARRVDEDLEYSIRISSPSEEEMLSGSIGFSEIPKSIFTKEIPLYILTPYITRERLGIFYKARRGAPIPRGIIKCGVAEPGFSTEIRPCGSEHRGYIPFIQSEDISPYHVAFSNKCFPESMLSAKKLRDFRQRKIVIPGMARDIYCGYDSIGCGCGRVYYITEDESPYTLSYLAALFNSSLFKFIYRLAYGMSHLSGDYLRINAPYLQIFRIKEIDGETAKNLEDLVNRIVVLKKARHKLHELWRELSGRFKEGEYTLYDMLLQDPLYPRNEGFSKDLSFRVSIHPDRDLHVVLSKPFDRFVVVGRDGENLIEIYGLAGNGEEEKILWIRLSDREPMLHIYHSLLQALGSRKRIRDLRGLLGKARIALSRDPLDLALSIVRRAGEEFRRWLEAEKIENIDPDIVRIDNEIADLEAMVDAMVFKVYELDESEIEEVFNLLKTPRTYRNRVLEHIKRL